MQKGPAGEAPPRAPLSRRRRQGARLLRGHRTAAASSPHRACHLQLAHGTRCHLRAKHVLKILYRLTYVNLTPIKA